MEYIVTLLPVLLLLFLFYLLDSFKLVPYQWLFVAFLSGCLAALAAFWINTQLISVMNLDFGFYSRTIAPFTEELLKAIIIVVMVKRKRIGFLIDAAVYGFASGAGFAVSENLYYLSVSPDSELAFLTLRGFGTAVMHSGCTALLAVLTLGAMNAEKKMAAGFIPGLILAYFIHSSFNHFYFNPILQTLLVTILVPSLLIVIFKYNGLQLQKWLEIEFFSEAELLSRIQKGEFSNSKSGRYVATLKDHFSPETIVDMYCYITLYLELSIKSKRNIMLAECGLPVVKEPDLDEKMNEFRQLRKSLGKSGELALSPLIRLKQRDLWKLTKL